MSLERLRPHKQREALEALNHALPLLTKIETEITSIPPANTLPASGTGHANINYTSFSTFRELWRWVSRLLWRATVIAARTNTNLWTWLSHYSACSQYWPANFRPKHRSAINTVYLRALVLSSPSSLVQDRRSGKLPPWLHTARTVINEYRAILAVSTRFPKAGERNVKVEEFVDLCVAVWEVSGAVGGYAGWVIDVS